MIVYFNKIITVHCLQKCIMVIVPDMAIWGQLACPRIE
jgi:hypothetical protein